MDVDQSMGVVYPLPILDRRRLNRRSYLACVLRQLSAGTTTAHVELEKLVARFLNKEDCVVFNMGYGTNATAIPALCSAVSRLEAEEALRRRRVGLAQLVLGVWYGACISGTGWTRCNTSLATAL